MELYSFNITHKTDATDYTHYRNAVYVITFSLRNAIAARKIINSNDIDFYLYVRLFSEFSQHSTRQSDARKFMLNKVSGKCDKLNLTYSFVLNWNYLPNNVTASTDSNVFYKLLMSHIVSQLG